MEIIRIDTHHLPEGDGYYCYNISAPTVITDEEVLEFCSLKGMKGKVFVYPGQKTKGGNFPNYMYFPETFKEK